MELNHQRAGLQPAALPLELPVRILELARAKRHQLWWRGQELNPHSPQAPGLPPGFLAGESLSGILELTVRFELTTDCLQSSCSAS